jgi:hypothetical protein
MELSSSSGPGPTPPEPAQLATLPEEELLEAVQRCTFRYFWEGGHPASGLAFDRLRASEVPADQVVTSGGSGFAVMALIVAVERAWVSRAAALERLDRMLEVLVRSPCYHGAFPHFMNGRTGATIPFMRKDDGGDLVETSLLLMGLICARQYFDAGTPLEASVRGRVDQLWRDVEWSWYTREGRPALYWHWSPNNGWALDLPIRGWNECLITYLLAVAAPRYAVDPWVYHRGFASGPQFLNRRAYFGVPLPLGPPFGGPLYFAHYSFCALDPRGLEDRYADYWEQNVHHVRINHAHCVRNPHGYAGYGPDCWGLTSSDDVQGYAGHAPDYDSGTIAPTAAISSLPYAPEASLAALRAFLGRYGERLWSRYGFVDAFSPQQHWYADTFLAIDQGPIIIMIENHRTQLLWRLFMGAPEIRAGLAALGFMSPHLATRASR